MLSSINLNGLNTKQVKSSEQGVDRGRYVRSRSTCLCAEGVNFE